MNIERALSILEGCLIEVINNPLHDNIFFRKVAEVQSETFPERVCGYGPTYEKAIIDAARIFNNLIK